MLFSLPTTKKEVKANLCGEYINTYMTLGKTQKKRWLKTASAKNGAMRLSQPEDATTIQINLYSASSNDYSGCKWIDKDPYD